MRYKAMFEIPISFEIEVEEMNLLVDRAEKLLKERAVEFLNEKYGHRFAMDFKQIKRVGNLSGRPVTETRGGGDE